MNAGRTLGQALEGLYYGGFVVTAYDTDAYNEPRYFAELVDKHCRDINFVVSKAVGFLGYGEHMHFNVRDPYGVFAELKLWYEPRPGGDGALHWSTTADV
jgi:hypothetical protein